MLTIRLKPMGRTYRKFYRIVVAQKHKHTTKKSIEDLGWYNPYTKEKSIKQDRINHYVALNIEVSDTVKSLLK